MLRKDYDHKGLVKNISGREPQGAWRQDELIGCKPSAIKHQYMGTRSYSRSENRTAWPIPTEVLRGFLQLF
jgi:hypothetical protein